MKGRRNVPEACPLGLALIPSMFGRWMYTQPRGLRVGSSKLSKSSHWASRHGRQLARPLEDPWTKHTEERGWVLCPGRPAAPGAPTATVRASARAAPGRPLLPARALPATAGFPPPGPCERARPVSAAPCPVWEGRLFPFLTTGDTLRGKAGHMPSPQARLPAGLSSRRVEASRDRSGSRRRAQCCPRPPCAPGCSPRCPGDGLSWSPPSGPQSTCPARRQLT